MKRRASKLRSFVPKPVDRKIDGSEENETEDKLPELKETRLCSVMHPIGGDVRNRLYNGITKRIGQS